MNHLLNHKRKIHKSEEEIEAFNTDLETLILKETCKYCKNKFLNANVLKFHTTYAHRQMKKNDISCELCNKTFKYSGNRDKIFENHVKRCKGDLKQEDSKNMTVENFMNFFNSLTS